jgi:hypothetical protein
MERFDVTSVMDIISEGSPHLRYCLFDHSVARECVVPNLCKQLGLRDGTLVMLGKIAKQLHGTWLQCNYFVAAVEQINIGKNVEGRKVESVRSSRAHALASVPPSGGMVEREDFTAESPIHLRF